MLPLCLVWLAHELTAGPLRLFVSRDPSRAARDRSLAMGCYATAPLAWLFPLALLLISAFYLLEPDDRPHSVALTINIASWTIAAIAVLGTAFRVLQLRQRINHSGALGVMVDLAHLMGTWVLWIVSILVMAPWCIGYVSIAIDSFR